MPPPSSPAPVRILINALHARSGGGLTYLRNLLPLLAVEPGIEIHLCLHRNQLQGLEPLPSGLTVHAMAFKDGFVRRLLWEQARVPGLARRLGATVTFSPANFGPLLAPGSVILLRNAIAVVESEPRIGKRLYWLALSIMTTLSLLACRRAIAVSDYAGQALTKSLPAGVRRRISVIHHGVSSRFSPPSADRRRDDFLLVVADFYIQKNIHGLLAALDFLRKEFPTLRLRIAGAPIDRDYAARIATLVSSLDLGNHVEMLGMVPAEELADLYRRCALFIFPSLAETFGNPLAEAMASGTPIVCSHTTAMPEILGDAGLYFDPRNPAEIAARIGEALRDPVLRERLSEKALDRARGFSWRETARRTADVFRAVAHRS